MESSHCFQQVYVIPWKLPKDVGYRWAAGSLRPIIRVNLLMIVWTNYISLPTLHVECIDDANMTSWTINIWFFKTFRFLYYTSCTLYMCSFHVSFSFHQLIQTLFLCEHMYTIFMKHCTGFKLYYQLSKFPFCYVCFSIYFCLGSTLIHAGFNLPFGVTLFSTN